MDTKFTTKSQEALSAAASNAATAGNPNIEPAHVLKALMDQRDGVAVAVLQATGANADAVSIKASNIIHEMPSASGTSTAQPQLSRTALQALQAAENYARDLKDEYVSTEHLLYGLAAGRDKTAEALQAAGVTTEALAQAIPQVRGEVGS